ncbi:hypothetical protein FSP39_002188 [Pinctada imbricata]|uniref:Kelch domain-containing protein 9 n=1 Tax=Pinctada imbricata TaxID=66713 RepID=A0AA88XR78_PINIB|nr:hypothetical protein FSP39_002188 [Pinctada imbricata]
MAQASRGTSSLIDWKEVNASGPARAFHTGCVIGNSFYIHGGIMTKDSKDPSSSLFQLNPSSFTWSEVSFPGSPSLSHHASVALSNRYFVLIGGWNGKSRTADIFVFDTQKSLWIKPKVSGFPEGGGLSSHTATLLDNGEILILGREGSLRTQRRHGSGYVLTGSVESGQFTYREYTQATASRSGHTATIVGNKLYIVGGRDNNLIERHQGFKSGESSNVPATKKLADAIDKLESMAKYPGGRKNHIAIGGPGVLFLHGGETFDGRSREPVGEMFLYGEKPVLSFYKIGNSAVGRAGHVCAVKDDKILIHGGTGGRSTIYGNTFQLTFNF